MSAFNLLSFNFSIGNLFTFKMELVKENDKVKENNDDEKEEKQR